MIEIVNAFDDKKWKACILSAVKMRNISNSVLNSVDLNLPKVNAW